MTIQIPYKMVMFGADPEFFFSKDGAVIGAEKVLPKEGIPGIIIDGVQAEFNIKPDTCRQRFSGSLRTCFLQTELLLGKGVTADFSQTVTVTEKEMQSLSKEAQQFGCAPSKNAYQEAGLSIQDASTYRYRSAGGHIHLGLQVQNPEHLVKLLDILLGNTCVLLDRDPGNVERRKVYGRAGEYRLPAHGLEYRTLSNFWLRDYKLTSFVLAMARFAVCVADSPEASKAVIEAVSMKDIRNAINLNDYDLAMENFLHIRDVVTSIIPQAIAGEDRLYFPLQGKRRMNSFLFLAEQGIDLFFSKDVLANWSTSGSLAKGWETFADYGILEYITSLKKSAEPAKKMAENAKSFLIGNFLRT